MDIPSISPNKTNKINAVTIINLLKRLPSLKLFNSLMDKIEGKNIN